VKLNKTDLIARVAAKADLTKTDVGKALNALIEEIQVEVAAGNSVALQGFGTFRAHARPGREGRNPATGEPLEIPARTVPKFLPGKEFKIQVGGS